MKKITTIGILILVAAYVQAGAVMWTASAIRDPSGATTITSVDKLYVELYYLSAGALDTTPSWETTFGSSGTLIKGGYVDNVTGNQGGVTALSSGQLGWEFWDQATAEANRDANLYASFYMKVYYNAAGSASTINYSDVGTTHLFTVYLGNVDSQNATAAFSGVSPNSHIQWQAIPEPTTMALFGLGGLAMVLRRKFRKEA